MAELRAGLDHPKRNTLLEWERLYQEHDATWQALTDAERDGVSARYREEASPQPTPAVAHHLGIEAELEALDYEQLRPGSWQRSGRHWTNFVRGWMGDEWVTLP